MTYTVSSGTLNPTQLQLLFTHFDVCGYCKCGSLHLRLVAFPYHYPFSSTFLSIHAVPRSVTFCIKSTFTVIPDVLMFSSRPLGIVPKAPIPMCITLASTFQSLLISSYYYYHHYLLERIVVLLSRCTFICLSV